MGGVGESGGCGGKTRKREIKTGIEVNEMRRLPASESFQELMHVRAGAYPPFSSS